MFLKEKKLRLLFLKSLSVTMAVILAVGGVSLIILRKLVKPPSVSEDSKQPHFDTRNYINESAFDFAEPHPDDAHLNAESPFNLINSGDWVRKENFFTVLAFGHDEGLNTDTIMVAAYDADERQAYIISIPRDTRVDVRRDIQRINSAYSVGMRNGGGRDGGTDQLLREVQTIIGFRPDFYVSVDENAFVRLIDAVGGVDINVPYNMRYEDPEQNLYINIAAGPQRLNGRNALHFVRYRMGNNGGRTITDYQRIENQQQLINAVKNELLSPRLITRIPELISNYRDNVNTDLTLLELMWFAEEFVLGDVTIHSYRYPTESIRTATNAGRTIWYEIINADEALELINSTINPFTREITMANLQLAR